MKSDVARVTLNQSNRIGHFLVREGLISPGHMRFALYDHCRTGLTLEEILVLHGWIDRQTFHRTLLKRCREQLKDILESTTNQAEATLLLQQSH